MKISVLLPVYGVERYIRRCAESLFRQTMTEGVEFIFVDDASPDRCVEILHEVMSEHPGINARVISHERNRYVSAARRTGLEAATGDYIAFVDPDDYVDPEYLEQLYAKAIGDDADIVFSNVIEERANGSTVKESRWADGYEDLGIATLMGSNSVYLWGKLIRRSLYTAHPECIAPDDQTRKEDYYSTVRLAHFARKLSHTGEAHYHYDKTNTGSITHGAAASQFDGMILFWQRTDDFFSRAFPDGRYAEAIARAKTQDKAELMLYRYDAKASRRYAGLYRKEEGRHMWGLSRGLLLMALLVRYHLWPLVDLYAGFVKWKDNR